MALPVLAMGWLLLTHRVSSSADEGCPRKTSIRQQTMVVGWLGEERQGMRVRRLWANDRLECAWVKARSPPLDDRLHAM